MSRSVPWRRTVTDAVSWRQDQAQNATIYILREMGPTGFLLKEEGEVKKFKVFLGDPNKCTCPVFTKEKDLCKHICWVLLKKFRIPRQNPLTFQIGLVEREINEILRGLTQKQEVKRHVSHKPVAGPKNPYGGGSKQQLEQRPLTEDDICPICQDELLGKHEPVTYCRFGCAKSIHIKCMKVWAEHQRSTGEEVIKCPLCREHFGPIDAIQEEYRNSSIRKTRAERLDLHLGSTCSKCGVAPIAGKCYKCCVCAEYFLCHGCFLTPTHQDHSFQFRQKPSQRWRPAPRCSDIALPHAVIGDMENRELTDNDYETLLQLDSEAANVPSTVPESFIKSLPSETVRQGSGLLVPGEQCRVCLRAYNVGDRVRRLNCQHKFHASCIDPWLLHQRGTCPIDGTTVYNPLMEALAREERRKKNTRKKMNENKKMVQGNKKAGWGQKDEQGEGFQLTFELTGSSIMSSTQPNRRRMKTSLSPARLRSTRGDSDIGNPLGISTFQNLARPYQRHLPSQEHGDLINIVQDANESPANIGVNTSLQINEDNNEFEMMHSNPRTRNASGNSRDLTPERVILQTRVETIQFDGSSQSNYMSPNWHQRPPRPPYGPARQSGKPQAPSIPLRRHASMTPVGNRLSGAMSAPHRQTQSDDSPSNSDTERGRGRLKGRLMHRRTRSSSTGRRPSIDGLHPGLSKPEMYESIFLGSTTGKTFTARRDNKTKPTKPAHRLRGSETVPDPSLLNLNISLTGLGVGNLQLDSDE